MKLINLSIAVGLIVLSGCNNNSNPNGETGTVPSSVKATQAGAYTISVFAQAPGALRPDDLLQVGKSVFVVYQDNNVNPDGTLATGVTAAQSQVIEYDTSGKVLQTFNVPGHPDGLLAYDATTVWVSSNEDANPIIIAIDTTTNAMTTLTSDVPTLPHGGGLDDMKLINGVVYASASNPALTTTPVPNLAPYSTDASGSTAINGVSTVPAVYAVTANSDGATFHVNPVLMSSSNAVLLPASTAITLNMTDPDSSAIDPAGDLVTVSQQDSELVFLSNLATTSPSVSVLPLTLYGNPWAIDDIRWSPASGNSFMLLSDNKASAVYRIDAAAGFPGSTGFPANVAFGAGQGTLLQIDTSTGAMTPVFVGLTSPHGIIFVE